MFGALEVVPVFRYTQPLSATSERVNPVNKIAIIGSSGSGKSTLARHLGDKLELPVHHLDRLLWKKNWELTSREEQIAIQNKLVQNDKWIIDGNYGATMSIRTSAADTIIFLDIPRMICCYRALKRTWQYRKTARPDMAEGNQEQFNLAFMHYIWTFPKEKRQNLLTVLSENASEKRIITLKSSNDMKEFLSKV